MGGPGSDSSHHLVGYVFNCAIQVADLPVAFYLITTIGMPTFTATNTDYLPLHTALLFVACHYRYLH